MKTVRSTLVLGLLTALTVGCTAPTGKTAGQNIDDAKIAAAVKTRLAGEKGATLTTVDVDTNLGTVYLSGTADTVAMKQRATELARQVSGVREVVSNLKVR